MEMPPENANDTQRILQGAAEIYPRIREKGLFSDEVSMAAALKQAATKMGFSPQDAEKAAGLMGDFRKHLQDEAAKAERATMPEVFQEADKIFSERPFDLHGPRTMEDLKRTCATALVRIMKAKLPRESTDAERLLWKQQGEAFASRYLQHRETISRALTRTAKLEAINKDLPGNYRRKHTELVRFLRELGDLEKSIRGSKSETGESGGEVTTFTPEPFKLPEDPGVTAEDYLKLEEVLEDAQKHKRGLTQSNSETTEQDFLDLQNELQRTNIHRNYKDQV